MIRLLVFSLIIIITTQLWSQNGSNTLKENYSNSKLSDGHSRNLHLVNDSIGIVYGYLSDTINSRVNAIKNVYFITYDYGENWKMKKFPGSAYIYTVYSLENGHIWMGGSDNILYHSDNYGDSFAAIGEPLDDQNRILSIYMKDAYNGIIGGLSGDLKMTQNNWKSFMDIETPLEQGKYSILEISSRDRINQVGVYNGYLLIDQNEHIYYSTTDSINWEEFIGPVSTFKIKNDELEVSGIYGWKYILDENLCQIDRFCEMSTEYFSELSKCLAQPKLPLEFDEIEKLEVVISKPIYVRPGHIVAEYAENKLKFVYNIRKRKYRLFHNDLVVYKNRRFSVDSMLINIRELLLNQGNSNEDSTLIYLEDVNYHTTLENNLTVDSLNKEWGGDFSRNVDFSNSCFYSMDYINPYDVQRWLGEVYVPTDYPSFPMNGHTFELNIFLENKDVFRIQNNHLPELSIPFTYIYNNKVEYVYDQNLLNKCNEFLEHLGIDVFRFDSGPLFLEFVKNVCVDKVEKIIECR